MMNAKALGCCAAVALALPVLTAAGSREQLPNQITAEVGGRMPLLGIDYERWFNEFFGVGVGLGGVPCIECNIGSNGAYGGYIVFTVPLYAVVNVPFAKNHGLSLSAGATLALPGHGQSNDVIPSVGVGYQLFLAKGFVLRPSLLLLFGDNFGGGKHVPSRLMFWEGLLIGWAF
jgi:hypothetical protein